MSRRRPLPRGARRTVVTRAWHGFMRHRGLDAAAALTFFATLSALPSALVIVSAFALADDRRRAGAELGAIASTFAGDQVAAGSDAVVEQLLSIDEPMLGLVVGIVLLLWSVSGYATAFGRAVNSIYEVQEGRQIWKFRGTMLLVAVVLIVLFAGVAAILLITPTAAAEIAGGRGLEPTVGVTWNIVKWPMLPVLLFVILGILFYSTPNVRLTHRRWASYGSLLAIGLWFLGTGGFALYSTLIGRYEGIYGGLGMLLVALLWLYVTNLSLVFGGELDAEIVRLNQLLAGEPAEEVIRLPMRDTARNLMLARQRHADIAASLRIREQMASVEREDDADQS